ncbi:MAG: transcriptional regulator [Elusimicrobia bacterium]|nr:transcriptional regulator [Elusimicrobiota bacterium]
MTPDGDYYEWLWNWLKDPKEAAGYLNAALEGDDPGDFLTAYYNVARAHGVKVIADKAKVHRVSLNKMFSKSGNPEWKSLMRVLAASKLRLRIEPATHRAA